MEKSRLMSFWLGSRYAEETCPAWCGLPLLLCDVIVLITCVRDTVCRPQLLEPPQLSPDHLRPSVRVCWHQDSPLLCPPSPPLLARPPLPPLPPPPLHTTTTTCLQESVSRRLLCSRQRRRGRVGGGRSGAGLHNGLIPMDF